MALLTQRHEWRGLSRKRDLLDHVLVLGWVTVWISKRPLVDMFWKMFGGPNA